MKHCLLLTSKYSVLIANVERRKNECVLAGMQESCNFPFVYGEADNGGSVVAINQLLVCFLLLLYCVIVTSVVTYVRVSVCGCGQRFKVNPARNSKPFSRQLDYSSEARPGTRRSGN